MGSKLTDLIKTQEATPTSLQEAVVYFANSDNCLYWLASRRWKDGTIKCPTCGSDNVSFVPTRRVWQCKTRHDRCQFSIKIGTILEDSPLGLDKWLPVMWMIANDKNRVSSYEIHRAIKVTQKTAWFMLHRVRLAMQDDQTGGKLCGEVEVDETFIGGKARNMHKDKRAKKITGRGPGGKAIVAAVLERGGRVRAKVVENRRKGELQKLVRENVEVGSMLFSDALKSYDGLTEFQHQVVDHAIEYVRGNVHTNGSENFWSLFKRCINGTYISVEPFHLFRYVDEEAFRLNNRRDMNDADRFTVLVDGIIGKRVTYQNLIGRGNKKPAEV